MKIPRWLRRTLVGLAAFELVYVAAGIFLVQSGQVDRWLNKSPEKRKISFESAWTVIPGVAHVRGFRMTHQGRKDQIGLVVDRATGFVNPLELIARRIHVIGIHAGGVEFRYRKRPETKEEAEARAAVVPPIEGLEYEPHDEPPKKKKRGWTVVFTGARIQEVRDVWMEARRLRGSGEVAASVTIGAGADKRVSIRGASVRYEGEYLISGEPVITGLALQVDGRMEPFHTKQTRGEALLGLISARVELSGRGSAGNMLNQYFGKAGWLEFRSDLQEVSARLQVDRGLLRPGGHVEVEPASLGLELAGFIVEGQAAARLETVAAEQGDVAEADLKVSYTEYGMRREADGPSVMKGEGLLIQARSPADLSTLPPEQFAGVIELGGAEFPDLVFVNDFLPPGASLTVKGGRGAVHGRFETDGMEAACRGSLTVASEGLVLDASGVDVAGDLELTVEVPDGNLRQRTFGLGGTRVDLDRFAFTSQESPEDLPDWWGRLRLTEGDLDLGEEAGVDTRLELAMSDTRPLVAFLSRDKPLSGWKERLLTLEEITGEGDVVLKDKAVVIRRLEVRGPSLEIQARGQLGPGGAFGKARANLGILKAGIELRGDDRKIRLFGVGSWYQKDNIPGMPPFPPEHHKP